MSVNVTLLCRVCVRESARVSQWQRGNTGLICSCCWPPLSLSWSYTSIPCRDSRCAKSLFISEEPPRASEKPHKKTHKHLSPPITKSTSLAPSHLPSSPFLDFSPLFFFSNLSLSFTLSLQPLLSGSQSLPHAAVLPTHTFSSFCRIEEVVVGKKRLVRTQTCLH